MFNEWAETIMSKMPVRPRDLLTSMKALAAFQECAARSIRVNIFGKLQAICANSMRTVNANKI